MLILASKSPRRKGILEQAGFEVAAFPQDINEEALPGETACELVKRLAYEKAKSARENVAADADTYIVGADTIVWMDDLIFGKPKDEDDAKKMLHMLSGRTHYASTAVCLMKTNTEKFLEEVITTDVSFYELTDDEIDAYVATGDPLDKAGAYGYQSLGFTLVKEIKGDFYNVIGLPIGWLVRALREFS